MTESVSLSDYIRDTLVGIAQGVREAQQDADCGPLIGRSAVHRDNPRLSTDLQNNVVTTVEFDVATTVENNVAGKIGGSVKVVSIADFGAGGAKEEKSSAVSRVTFAVTLALPQPRAQAAADEARKRRDNSAIPYRGDLGFMG